MHKNAQVKSEVYQRLPLSMLQGHMPLTGVSENALLKAEVVAPYASLSKNFFDFFARAICSLYE